MDLNLELPAVPLYLCVKILSIRIYKVKKLSHPMNTSPFTKHHGGARSALIKQVRYDFITSGKYLLPPFTDQRAQIYLLIQNW